MSRSLRAHLLLFGVVAVWGATFVLIKSALRDVSPLLFNLIRMTLAFVFLAFFYRRQWRHLSRRAWKGGAVIGICLAIGFQLQTEGLRLTTPSNSAFITALMVVLIPLFGIFPKLRRPGAKAPRWNVWFGAFLAASGIVLLAMRSGGIPSIHAGDLLTIACAFAFALQIITQDRISGGPPGRSIPFEQLALLQVGFSAAWMAITAPLLERPHLHLSGIVILALAVTSTVCTAAAFSIQSWVQQFLSPSRLVLIYAFEPVFAWLTSLVLLGEGLSARGSLGALLILAGMGAAEWIGGA